MSDLADAYVWGYPLVAMHHTCAAHGGVGRGMVARRGLATAADRTVVAPNNDTLYASGWFDLRAGDLTVGVGPLERYWSVMLLDAYTHVAYVCRRLHGTGGATVRVTYDPATGPTGDRATDVVAVGTPTVWVLTRVLVAGPHDLDAARTALAQVAVHQAGAGGGPSPGTRPSGGEGFAEAARTQVTVRQAGRTVAGEGFFGELRAALEVDPPAVWHPPAPPGLHRLLDDPPGGEALDAAVAEGRARMAGSTGVDRVGNGWGTRSRGADFGDDVAYRAAFARISLAGHLPAENRSYSRRCDGATRAALRFPPGGEPPVDGFWSLCAYGPDLFLVGNELGRHSICDRTPGLLRGDDGSLTITVSHERPADREVANWLPTPDGPCVLTLRAYEGRDDVVAGRWFPPDLEPCP